MLKRAIRTLWIALDALDQMWIPVEKDWRLNERHYGALQGLNKAETAAKHGDDQVKIWRRSYDIPPPPLDARRPAASRRTIRATPSLAPSELPLTESLKDTVARFLPYWHETIAPAIRAGQRVLIAAHGNSLRALVKYLDNVSESDIVELNIPTGIPLVYELDDDLKPIRHYYLGDPAAAAAAAAKRRESDQGIALGGSELASRRTRENEKGRRAGAAGLIVRARVSVPRYSTGSAVSSAAIRSERRNRRSLAVTSNARRGCTTRAGVATFASVCDCCGCERLTNPTTASSVTFISKPAARAFSRHASTCGFSATAAAIASASSRANRLTTSSILVPLLRHRAGFPGALPDPSPAHRGGGRRSGICVVFC